MCRDGAAYPGHLNKLTEECGDFLWYLVRYSDIVDVNAPATNEHPVRQDETALLRLSLELCASVAKLESADASGNATGRVVEIWRMFGQIVPSTGAVISDIAAQNLAKIRSRWPATKTFHPLFDEECPAEEQLPRELSIEFVETTLGSAKAVTLRYRGIGIGDRITDNIADPDGYRFHDVFHVANAVYLGWSPVLRSLLRCKRKSRPEFDRDQDGARAAIMEEAVSAIVFRRAKEMNHFRGSTQIDYDLLKMIQQLSSGYEVDAVPVWQWERAILEGYRVFEEVVASGGGRIAWSIPRREITFQAPSG